MFSIPKKFELSCMIGLNIQQVCYSLNSISLLFEGGGYITIKGMFRTIIKDKINQFELSVVDQDYGLLEFIEKTIVSVNSDADRTDLCLFFGKGLCLQIFGDEYFESYNVSVNGIEFIV